MKRNLLVLFILMLVLTLVGCKEPINETNSDKVIKNDNEPEYLNSNDDQVDNDNSFIEVELPADYRPMEVKDYDISPNLERLSLRILEGDGIPSIILKDPSEYKNKNPWFSNKDVKVLPVFTNKNYNPKYHEGPVEYLTEEEAIEVSLLVADKLGLDSTKYQCVNYDNSNHIYFPNKEEPFVEILPSIEEIRIFFNPYINGNGSLSNINEDNEDILHEKYLIHYYNLFEGILNMDQPVFESCFERNIYGEKQYHYKIFNQEDTAEDTLVNYSTNYVRIYIDNDGLWGIDLSYKQLLDGGNSNEYENTVIEKLAKRNELEIIGYYPLISEEEAIEKVLNKEYLSTIEYDRDVDLSDIISIELIYYWVPVNKEIQPVYKVYLDLKNTINDYQYEEEDLNTYGIFYVPAIESKYLDLMGSN